MAADAHTHIWVCDWKGGRNRVGLAGSRRPLAAAAASLPRPVQRGNGTWSSGNATRSPCNARDSIRCRRCRQQCRNAEPSPKRA